MGTKPHFAAMGFVHLLKSWDEAFLLSCLYCLLALIGQGDDILASISEMHLWDEFQRTKSDLLC